MIRNVPHVDRLSETSFDLGHIGRAETLMTQGNGYLGIRGSYEEDYTGSIRGCYVAGTYNKDSEFEVAELPNLADLIHFEIQLDGETFRMDQGKLLAYNRSLIFDTGELVREIRWESCNGCIYRIVFRRFVSQRLLHAVISQVEITPETADCKLLIHTGINGRMTNAGTQNMHETEKRVFENRYMQVTQQTTQSRIDVIYASMLERKMDGESKFISERRKLMEAYKADIGRNRTLVITKKSVVTTSLDRSFVDAYDVGEARELNLAMLQSIAAKSYTELLVESADARQLGSGITIASEHNFDQLSINFAAYHLNIMAPAHDNRFSIGAKGLTGEGYKAHVFWDTEIFMLPYFLYNAPETAKKLLEYRYGVLEKAKEKALRNGYEGTLYPWESALTGEEETPEFAAMNIKTGTRERVHSADKEHHIVADIAYSVLEYEKATGDRAFMQEMGVEMLMEASRFWVSRADKSKRPYSILNIIGPDEYTEHIDNNAYTNYLAHEVVSKTLEKMAEYGSDKRDEASFRDFVANLYLPQTTEAGVIPQDDSFLTKPIIDLEKYRAAPGKQLILQDFTRSEVVNMQILKQADAVMLLYVLPELFGKHVAESTWNYYEPKTIHDSSLSMCMHSIVALQFGEVDKSYACFEKGERIDLGEHAHCTDGIHAASLGAIYLSVVAGFGGVSVAENRLRIDPQLPKAWSRLRFPFVYRNERIWFTIDKNRIHIARSGDCEAHLSISCNGQTYVSQGAKQSLEIEYC
ncbi:glycosyl hydrolase family 65 protein [Paenibacillus sp. OV219]|uniref:glycosyl hydrolase family 65 protein n=1 Tax=Paenibacillus sp. OV219 TaxID=1884377 RepID=UPI0008ACFF57|nr:glycosyl hydrolase family 65 protein [Paenibacillus sp. OV219]SEO12528.1 hypothetical glycosyl hydrolase [Paenibacillus sp. OV219]